MLKDDDTREDVVVVDTDLANGLGYMTIDRGAVAKTKVRGEYIWHDCTLVDWVNVPKEI